MADYKKEDIQKIIDAEMLTRDKIAGVKVEGKNKKVIVEEYLNNSIFVEAGAGAGKTYTIVQRVMNQLCIGMKPGEIVVITFTNKAAEELRGRIATGLRDRIFGDEAGNYEQYQDNLRDAFNHLDDMNISTIHSFCFKLLKERCFDAKLPMDLGLLDNEGTEEQKDILFEEWLATLAQKDWEALQDDDPNSRSRYRIKKELKSIYNAVCTAPAERKVHVEDKPYSVDEDALFHSFEVAIIEVASTFEPNGIFNCLDDVYDYYESNPNKKSFLGARFYIDGVRLTKYVDKDNNIDYQIFWKKMVAEEVKSDSRGKEEPKGFAKYKQTSIVKKVTGKEYKAFEDDMGDILDIVHGFVRDNIEQINDLLNYPVVNYRNNLYKYAENAREYYAKNKSISNLTNDALLELTRDMILGSDEAQAYFAKKYSCFYVDEFQDTDNVQESFIWRLASKTENANELRAGALFIVGDPKQSIYRFRGAEPEVYMNVKARMKLMEEAKKNVWVFDLQINFRSNDLIIKWVNDRFSETEGHPPIMVSKNGGPAYEYQNMIAQNSLSEEIYKNYEDVEYALKLSDMNDNNIIAGVYKYVSPAGVVDKSSEAEDIEIVEEGEADENEFDEQELNQNVPPQIGALQNRVDMLSLGDSEDIPKQDLADLIINLYDNEKFQIFEKKRGEGKPRKIRFSDIMVLCKNKTNMNSYLDYLTLRGIPVQIAGDTYPKEIVELNAFVRIYSYVANRKSQLDRVAALEAIRELGLTDNEYDLEVVGRDILDKIYHDTANMSAYGIAIYLLNHISILVKKNKAYSEFECLSIKTKLVQMIEKVCRDNYGTPKAISQKFKDYLELNVEHELSLKEKIDAVQFMNIHKSKGLEGNIVIIMDRQGKAYKSPESFLYNNEYYPRSKQYPELRDLEIDELAAESRRLEYVAATRAGQALIFMDCLSVETLFCAKDGDVYDLNDLESIENVILEKINMPPSPKDIVSDENKYDLEEEAKDYEQTRSTLDEEDIIPGCQRISPSNFESGHSITKNRAIARAIEQKKKREDEYSKCLERPVGNVFGTCMHRALELLVDRYGIMKTSPPKAQTAMVEGCARQAVIESSDDIKTEEIEIYFNFINSLLKAYYVELNKQGWLDESNIEYKTELPFSYYEEDTNDDRNQISCANKHLKESRKLKNAPVWMNGSADLVVRKNIGTDDEEIVIIDYKSDNDYFLTDSEFHQSMSEKYIGQLDNYKYAMSKLFGIDENHISMKVVSFSQKDEKGKVFEDETVRIRVTEIVANNLAV